jgi:hypothetical protein
MKPQSNQPQNNHSHEIAEQLLLLTPDNPTLTAYSIESPDGSVIAYETRLQLDGGNALRRSFETLEDATLDFAELLWGGGER